MTIIGQGRSDSQITIQLDVQPRWHVQFFLIIISKLPNRYVQFLRRVSMIRHKSIEAQD
jgi:hypothetical protein